MRTTGDATGLRNVADVDPRVRTAIHLVRTESARAWTVEGLAQMVSLSASHLRKLFVRELGVTPKTFLKRHQMTQAVDLLTSSHLRVKEIMRRVGASDPSHFTRDFAARFGSSPTTFRRRRLKPCRTRNGQ
jgi:AraC-like DNA-binding protein